MTHDDKIVRYDRYCKSCANWKLKQDEEPCNTCLDNPTNLHSRKPVCYKPTKGIKEQPCKKK